MNVPRMVAMFESGIYKKKYVVFSTEFLKFAQHLQTMNLDISYVLQDANKTTDDFNVRSVHAKLNKCVALIKGFNVTCGTLEQFPK